MMSTGSLTNAQVNHYRKFAVRGTLEPGLYRYVHGGPSTPFYRDILVTAVKGVPESPRVPGPRYEYLNINGYNSVNVEDRRGFLSDAGVVPYREEGTVTKTCCLGHSHTETVPAFFNTNFLVPLVVFAKVW